MKYHDKDKNYEGSKIESADENINTESSGSYICGPVKPQNNKLNPIGGQASSTDSIAMECVADNNLESIGVSNSKIVGNNIENVSSESLKSEGFNICSNNAEDLTGNPLDLRGVSINSNSKSSISPQKATTALGSVAVASEALNNAGGNLSKGIEGISPSSVSTNVSESKISGFDVSSRQLGKNNEVLSSPITSEKGFSNSNVKLDSNTVSVEPVNNSAISPSSVSSSVEPNASANKLVNNNENLNSQLSNNNNFASNNNSSLNFGSNNVADNSSNLGDTLNKISKTSTEKSVSPSVLGTAGATGAISSGKVQKNTVNDKVDILSEKTNIGENIEGLTTSNVKANRSFDQNNNSSIEFANKKTPSRGEYAAIAGSSGEKNNFVSKSGDKLSATKSSSSMSDNLYVKNDSKSKASNVKNLETSKILKDTETSSSLGSSEKINKQHNITKEQVIAGVGASAIVAELIHNQHHNKSYSKNIDDLNLKNKNASLGDNKFGLSPNNNRFSNNANLGGKRDANNLPLGSTNSDRNKLLGDNTFGLGPNNNRNLYLSPRSSSSTSQGIGNKLLGGLIGQIRNKDKLIDINNDKLLSIGSYGLSFTTQEELSRNYKYRLTFASDKSDVDLNKLLGEGVNIRIELPDRKGYRDFYAYVIGGRDTGQITNKYSYELDLSTWLWFLTQNKNSKIFQNLNTLEIIEEIFSRYKFANYRLEIGGSYPKREYCVQFNESDFDFISRLLEYEGIWYYFEHEKDKHTLVITDNQNFKELQGGYSNLDFIPDGEDKRAIREGIQRINRNNQVRPTKVVLRDFDYLEPRKDLQIHRDDNTVKVDGSPLEWYHYSQNYLDADRGEQIAQLRLEEMASLGELLEGESNAVGLTPGKTFELSLHPDRSRNRKFKIIGTAYTFIQDGPDSANSEGRNIFCKFIALNDNVSYRPERITPWPQVSGIQSATVVGPVQSEVYTDKHGRIKVHFHWDRYKSTEEDSSCWIRVVQAWSGKGWGIVAMPRVGQEVLVNYVDGDLDRPLVVGIVYNGDNPPPYDLPKNINYSGLVSRSLKFGRPQNANLLTFDDRRSNERIMQHAERDNQEIAERNDSKFVGQDLFEVVKRISTHWYNAHFSYKNFHLGVTGLNVNFTGASVSNTGFSLSSTGASVSFVGSDTSFAGVSTGFVGNSTSFTGNSTSFTGNSSSFVGHAYSCTGSSDSFVSISNSVVGSASSFVGTSESTTGSSVGVTGSSVGVVGSSVSTTGSSVGVVGSSVGVVGSSVSTTGSSVSTTGSSVGVVGSSVSTTGSSVSTVGSSVSTVGVSMSTVGVSINKVGISITL